MTDQRPVLPGKYVQLSQEHDDDAYVYTLYSDGEWYREGQPIEAELVPVQLSRIFAFNPYDQELLSRAASSLAEHLDSWHGGPDEMYRESEQLKALAAHLAVDVNQEELALAGNQHGTSGKSSQWDQGYELAVQQVIDYLLLQRDTDAAESIKRSFQP